MKISCDILFSWRSAWIGILVGEKEEKLNMQYMEYFPVAARRQFLINLLPFISLHVIIEKEIKRGEQ